LDNDDFDDFDKGEVLIYMSKDCHKLWLECSHRYRDAKDKDICFRISEADSMNRSRIPKKASATEGCKVVAPTLLLTLWAFKVEPQRGSDPLQAKLATGNSPILLWIRIYPVFFILIGRVICQ